MAERGGSPALYRFPISIATLQQATEIGPISGVFFLLQSNAFKRERPESEHGNEKRYTVRRAELYTSPSVS